MKMKNIILKFLCFFLLTMISQASVSNMKCVTTLPTTSLLLDTDKESPELTVIHHNGKGYMPVHYGIVVPNDREFIQKKIDLLSKLPERMTYYFSKNKCKITDNQFVDCFGGKSIDVEGTRFTPLEFFSHRCL
jgi:hypothetical protein